MRRREFIGLLSGAIAEGPLAARAQQRPRPPGRVVRIGVLTLGVTPSTAIFEAFRQGLRELGYIEGRNIAIEFRTAQGHIDKLRAMADELVASNVDIIVTESSPAGLAAKQATQTIPIVMAIAGDPVQTGEVASYARPGANVTGLTLLTQELSAKRLQLLKEAVPEITDVAVVWNAANTLGAINLAETKAAARSLGIELGPVVEVRNPADLDDAFVTVIHAHPSAFITIADGMLLSNSVRVAEFAMKSRLPGIFPERDFAEAGALMAYGPSLAANFRRAAALVDKILNGAKPADIPIEQPTKVELIINLKTAKELGVTIPPSIMVRADEVIE
jgi:putative tryptophan/tyrosine transport system substrate-binding protein